MGEADLENLKKDLILSVNDTVKTVVNGKIDRMQMCLDEHNLKHSQDMERILPVVEAYETNERRLKDAKKVGTFAVAVATGLTAIGVSWLTFTQILSNH